MPSNKLKAFIKAKKQNNVNKNLNWWRVKIFSEKEKLIISILKDFSKYNNIKIITVNNNNLKFAFKSFLSSKYPTIKIKVEVTKNK